MTVSELLAGLKTAETRITQSPSIDHLAFEGLRLVLFPDGSGCIEADARRCTPDENRTEKMLRRVFSDWIEWQSFENHERLEQLLASMIELGK